MRFVPFAAAAAFTAICLPAAAQAPAAPAPAPLYADAPQPLVPAVDPPLVPPDPVPAPAPQATTAPAPAPQALYPQPDPAQARRVARLERRRQRDLRRLERVMEIEGPEFDEDRYARYRSQKGGGIALVAIGGVGLVSTLIYGFYVILDDAFGDWGEADSEQDDGRLGGPRQRVALWSMFVTGVTGLAVGVPLLVTGSRGKKRQELLRRKDEILAPIDPATAILTLTGSPDGGAGLRLDVRF